MHDSTETWIRFNIAEGIGTAAKLDLLRRVKCVEDLFEMDKQELMSLGLRPDQAESLLNEEKKRESARINESARKKGIRAVPINDAEYPEFLRYIHDPPMVLYVKGKIPEGLFLAIVGSRKASGYGIDIAFRIASELAEKGIMVVSGMARGIDTAAHTGALHAGGQTVAVLGCGPDMAYPPENKGLMERITGNGAVISEYPPGVGPQTYHFPVRNRIISGMAIGVLVVEAGSKSGSLITAQAALEQGREVFAVPGNINHFNSIGTNKLIREGAKLVLNSNDILEEIPWSLKTIPRQQDAQHGQLSENEAAILQHLRNEDLYADQLAERSSIQLHRLPSVLLELELKGLIRKDLTGRYSIAP